MLIPICVWIATKIFNWNNLICFSSSLGNSVCNTTNFTWLFRHKVLHFTNKKPNSKYIVQNCQLRFHRLVASNLVCLFCFSIFCFPCFVSVKLLIEMIEMYSINNTHLCNFRRNDKHGDLFDFSCMIDSKNRKGVKNCHLLKITNHRWSGIVCKKFDVRFFLLSFFLPLSLSTHARSHNSEGLAFQFCIHMLLRLCACVRVCVRRKQIEKWIKQIKCYE